MEQKAEINWSERDEIFCLAPYACAASEMRALENPVAAGKELKKWAELTKIICDAINEEGPDNVSSELLALVKRQKKKIRQIVNSLSANGTNPHLSEKIEVILSDCTLDTQ